QRFRFGIFSILTACSAWSCAGYDSTSKEEENFGTQTDALWLAAGATIWPGGVVPVCFDAGFTQQDRDAIRRVVDDGWERVANIDFNGWGNCPTLGINTTNLVAVTVGTPPTYFGQSVHCSGGTIDTCGG